MKEYTKKILISDYDQTFYINDEDIQRNKKAVEEFKRRGNIFVIATGRSYLDFHNKVNEYNIDYDYVIINHGATILDKDDNVFSNFSMNNDIIEKIKNDLQIEKSIHNFCCSALESRVNFDHKDLTKINVKYNSKDEAMEINENINHKYSDYVKSYYVSHDSVEIISNRTNKAIAIELLLERLGVDRKNAYIIGDGYSDIEMVKNFNGFAMKDSVQELKDIAKKEYESVSELINELDIK